MERALLPPEVQQDDGCPSSNHQVLKTVKRKDGADSATLIFSPLVQEDTHLSEGMLRRRQSPHCTSKTTSKIVVSWRHFLLTRFLHQAGGLSGIRTSYDLLTVLWGERYFPPGWDWSVSSQVTESDLFSSKVAAQADNWNQNMLERFIKRRFLKERKLKKILAKLNAGRFRCKRCMNSSFIDHSSLPNICQNFWIELKGFFTAFLLSVKVFFNLFWVILTLLKVEAFFVHCL